MNIFKLFARPIPPSYEKYNDLPEEIRNLTTPFGSRIWGGATKYSDMDLLAHPDTIEKITDYLKAHNIKYQTKNSGYAFSVSSSTFKYNNIVYQITFTDISSYVNSYNDQIKIIEIINAYTEHTSPITNKENRIELFNQVSYALKMNALPKHISSVIEKHNPELLL